MIAAMRTVLGDGEVTIRSLEPADAQPLYEAVRESIPALARWLPWAHDGYARHETEEWIASCVADWASGASFPFVIVDASTGAILGGTGVSRIDREHRCANLGYWVRSAWTGRGVATRAVRLVADFAFHDLKLTRIEIIADVDNAASRRVAEKAGARFECIARNRVVTRGRVRDAAVYSLVPADLEPAGAG
jgi:Acetyltransferases, including N-acetylases of ribosomal proteins